jgi:hypothetical protein
MSNGDSATHTHKASSTHFSNIVDLAVDDQPAVVRRVVLGHLFKGERCICTHRRRFHTLRTSDGANKEISSVLVDDLRLVKHLELLGRVLASEHERGLLSTRVVGEELGRESGGADGKFMSIGRTS